MNYELIMLNGIKRMNSEANKLQKEVKKLAIRSHCFEIWKAGTLAQVLAVSKLAGKRDSCLEFVNAALSALKSMPKGYAALLKSVYIKRTDKNYLSKRYKVPQATFYRILAKARKSLRCQLCAGGFSEKWFWTNYGDLGWTRAMADYSAGKGGRMSL